jgi:hypothetical protein
MNAGQLLMVAQGVIGLLETEGILRPDGTFDSEKLDTAQEDIAFGAKVEAVLKHYGLDVPEKVDKIIALLPIIAGLID